MVDLRGTPTFLYDGRCGFCRTWTAYWREQAGPNVVCEAYQDNKPAQARFGEEALAAAAHFIETDGTASTGARAVFLLMTHASGGYGWLLAAYDRSRFIAAACEAGYRFVTRHRVAAARITRFLWGRPHVSTFAVTRWLFLRALGVAYLAAFASAGTQLIGLVGAAGILPASGFLARAAEEHGMAALWREPTLAWFLGSSDAMLRFFILAGVMAAAAIIADMAVFPALLIAYGLLLTVTTIGQGFFAYQWDALLLEVGFIALLLAPRVWTFGRVAVAEKERTSGAVRLLLWLVLFKVTWGSGWAKLLSGDPSWQDLSGLSKLLVSQPLPGPYSAALSRLPDAALRAATLFALIIEFLVPFLFFMPRRLRRGAAALTVAFQAAALLGGNFGPTNLIVIVLCLALLDDNFYRSALSQRILGFIHRRGAQKRRSRREHASSDAAPVKQAGVMPTLRRRAAVAGLAILFGANAAAIASAATGHAAWLRLIPEPLRAARLVNAYAMFAHVGATRTEIEIQGSNDGMLWKPYHFAFKPDLPHIRPPMVTPHAPRLDLHMWLLQDGTWRDHPWFIGLLLRIFQGSPETLNLLASNPFADAPPRYIRAVRYEYRFTTNEEQMVDGAYWHRQVVGEYFPVTSFDTLYYALREK